MFRLKSICFSKKHLLFLLYQKRTVFLGFAGFLSVSLGSFLLPLMYICGTNLDLPIELIKLCAGGSVLRLSGSPLSVLPGVCMLPVLCWKFALVRFALVFFSSVCVRYCSARRDKGLKVFVGHSPVLTHFYSGELALFYISIESSTGYFQNVGHFFE